MPSSERLSSSDSPSFHDLNIGLCSLKVSFGIFLHHVYQISKYATRHTNAIPQLQHMTLCLLLVSSKS